MAENVVNFSNKKTLPSEGRRLPPKKKGRRAQPDWEYLEIFYRANYSFSQLAALPEADGVTKQAIHKHAVKNEWVRDTSGTAKREAQRRLALAAFKKSGIDKVTDDAIDIAADEKLLTVDIAPRAKSSRKDAQEAITQEITKVLSGHKVRSTRLTDMFEHYMGLLEEYKQIMENGVFETDSEDESDEEVVRRLGTIRMMLCGNKDSMVDVLNKLTRIHTSIQTAERQTWDLDAKQPEEIKPVVPRIQRRGSLAEETES